MVYQSCPTLYLWTSDLILSGNPSLVYISKTWKKWWTPLHLQLVPLLLKSCDFTSPLYINNLTYSKQNSSSSCNSCLCRILRVSVRTGYGAVTVPSTICAYCPHSEKLMLQPLFGTWPIIVEHKRKLLRVSPGNQMLGPELKPFFIMKVKLKVISYILSVLVPFTLIKISQIFKNRLVAGISFPNHFFPNSIYEN